MFRVLVWLIALLLCVIDSVTISIASYRLMGLSPGLSVATRARVGLSMASASPVGEVEKQVEIAMKTKTTKNRKTKLEPNEESGEKLNSKAKEKEKVKKVKSKEKVKPKLPKRVKQPVSSATILSPEDTGSEAVDLHVLDLMEGKKYVCISQCQSMRLEEHLLEGEAKGNSWTKQYPPVRNLLTMPLLYLHQQSLVTAAMMKVYGYDNVRGGMFSGTDSLSAEMKKKAEDLLQNHLHPADLAALSLHTYGTDDNKSNYEMSEDLKRLIKQIAIPLNPEQIEGWLANTLFLICTTV